MKRKTTCMILAGLMTVGAFSGCSGTANVEVKEAKTWDTVATTEIVYDCFGGTGDVMPILGFWNAPAEAMHNGQWFPNMKNDEYFAAVKESGINLLMQGNDDAAYYYDEAELTLDYCDKYEIGYYVTDSDLFNQGVVSASSDQLKEAIATYATAHKSFAGFVLRDEPAVGSEKAMNRGLKTLNDAAEELGLNIHGYMNLFPYWTSAYQPDPWTQYVEHATKIFKDSSSKLMAYDIYPLKESGMDYVWYFSNLSMFKYVADDLNIIWTPFVSVSAEGNYRMPTEGELSWQVHEYIAFGAKGINYFPINSPISFSDYVAQGNTVAMFDWLGNKTEGYYTVKEVNKQLLAADHYLMKANHHGVIINGELEGKEYLKFNEVIEEGTFRELTGASGDSATIGCFDYYGKTCFYVVNNSMTDDGQIQLNFDDRYVYEVIQRGESVNVKGKKIVLNLSAGEPAFIILK